MLDEAKWKQGEAISIILYFHLTLSNANLNYS